MEIPYANYAAVLTSEDASLNSQKTQSNSWKEDKKESNLEAAILLFKPFFCSQGTTSLCLAYQKDLYSAAFLRRALQGPEIQVAFNQL